LRNVRLVGEKARARFQEVTMSVTAIRRREKKESHSDEPAARGTRMDWGKQLCEERKAEGKADSDS
jgi:hypothetical protein